MATESLTTIADTNSTRHSVREESHSFTDCASSHENQLRDTQAVKDISPSHESGHHPTTYAEGLARLKGIYPQLDWLRQFFTNAGGRPPGSSSKALVIDFTAAGVDVQPSSIDTLRNTPENTEARVIFVSFDDLSGVDRRRLDEICYVLDLDPFAIRAVFEDGTDRYHEEDYAFPRLPEYRRQLHLEMHREVLVTGRVLRLSTSRQPGRSLSAVHLHQSKDMPATTVLFCDDTTYPMESQLPPPQEVVSIFMPPPGEALSSATVSEVYLDGVLRCTRGEPLLLFSLYMKLQIGEIDNYLAYLQVGVSDWSSRDSLREHPKVHNRLLDTIQYLTLSYESLQAFLTHHHLQPERGEPLLKELTRVREAVQDTLLRKKDTLATSAALLSATDAEKSIKAADSVTSLTKLAFVFVPLTFTTSIFGANITEFGSGNVSVSIFAALLVFTAALSALISWVLTWEHKQRVYWRFTRQVMWLFQFAQRAPLLATQLAVFALLSGGCFEDLCNLQVNYSMINSTRDEHDAEPSNLGDFPAATPGEPLLRRMKMNLLRRVALYTSQRGWQMDRFYRPSSRRRRLERAHSPTEAYSHGLEHGQA